jgi:hypothetical protein
VKWLHGRVEDIEAASRAAYDATFFLAVAYAFSRGAPRAAVELSWAAAAAFAAIPATSLFAVAAPGFGPWTSADPVSLGVDLVAFCGALSFVAMARAARRRVETGPPDSVWSARTADAGERTVDAPDAVGSR